MDDLRIIRLGELTLLQVHLSLILILKHLVKEEVIKNAVSIVVNIWVKDELFHMLSL